MTAQLRKRQRYDHRFRRLVQSTGDLGLAIDKGVPRSTARDWVDSRLPDVVTLDVSDLTEQALRDELAALRQQNARLLAILRLVVVLLKVSGFTLARSRVADGAKKELLLRAIEKSRTLLPLKSVLHVLRLSSTRYHSWKREEICELQDVSSCPRNSPQQLTRGEVEVVKDMVTSDEYRHVPTGTLSDLKKSSRPRLPGIDWFVVIDGDAHELACIPQSR